MKDSDPDSPAPGDVWFRGDAGEVRVHTTDGTQTLGGSSTSTADSTQVSFDVTEPFEDDNWTATFGDGWDYGLAANADIRDVAGRDGNQLQATVPGGENRGIYTIHNHAARTGQAPTSCYHSFALRFEPGFTDNITDDGKLPGFAGRDGTDEGAGGSPANGTGWSARMGWDDPSDHGPGIAVDWYIYHMDVSGSYGEHDYWGRLLEEDVWHDFEQYIDLGTPGENDGVLRGWIDGKLEYERTDLRFRDSGGNDVQWSWWDLYHGGGNTPSGNITVQFDDLGIVRGGMP
ncbi:polysaccharide lyase [Natronoarchaeum sp. GCM10025703]|uniref:polysaccharide lyase n=1 Tax=Natronoarchaeum sp. GCM10025703 TaxID=3252685 RepID=UPI003619E80B